MHQRLPHAKPPQSHNPDAPCRTEPPPKSSYSPAAGSALGDREVLGAPPSNEADGGWTSSMRGPPVSPPLTSLADATSSPCSVASYIRSISTHPASFGRIPSGPAAALELAPSAESFKRTGSAPAGVVAGGWASAWSVNLGAQSPTTTTGTGWGPTRSSSRGGWGPAARGRPPRSGGGGGGRASLAARRAGRKASSRALSDAV